VRVLNGLLKPTSGTALLFGKDVQKESEHIRSRCGVLTDTNLYEKLTALENLEIWGRLYGLKGPTLTERIEKVLEMFGLGDRKHALVASFSKGMKQKLAVARAMIHEPEILFLDEPTAGLDPEATDDLIQYLRAYIRTGRRTIVYASHRLEEVEALCETVAVINHGKILACGRIDELTRQMWSDITFKIEIQEEARRFAERIVLDRAVAIVSADGTALTVSVHQREGISPVIHLLVSQGARILSVVEERHTLKDIYFKILPKSNHEPDSH
jgi:ABC-2 type transport system ATP-binding protein